MVKRKANGSKANAASKKPSPDRKHPYNTRANAHPTAATTTYIDCTSERPPPGADTLICLEDLPDFVEHPREEILNHNSAVINRKIKRDIRAREENTIENLTPDAVVERLGLPLKQVPTCQDPARTQFTMAAAIPRNPYAHADAPADSEIAANSKWVQSNDFQAVQVTIDDFNDLTRYMERDGVPAANPYYKYITRSSTALVATTTGERVPINSFIEVKDLKRCLYEMQAMLDRLLGPARIPHGKMYSADKLSTKHYSAS